MAASYLSANNLSCERDDRLLFNGLNFDLLGGEGLQIVGPNGSGKTSLLRMLCDLLPATSGTIESCGAILYLGHKAAIKEDLTASENLALLSKLDRVKVNAEEVLQQLGLRGFEHSYCRQLSAGQQRRVALARLCNTPARIWLLDEPFTALDTQASEQLQQLIMEHREKGGIVIFSSHQDYPLPNIQRLNISEPAL